MAWVNGTAVSVGDVLFGWRLTDGEPTAYHHPFLVTDISDGAMTMRNCTTNASASFTTIEIPSADKEGTLPWANGRSSYFVTDGDEEVGYMTQSFDIQIGQEPREVPVGPPQIEQVQNADGSFSYRVIQAMQVMMVPVVRRVNVNVQYNKIGTVSSTWLETNLQ